MNTMVQIRLEDGRVVSVPRATPDEAWEAVVLAHRCGLDVGGAWQGVHSEVGVMLVPAALVVEPLRVVDGRGR